LAGNLNAKDPFWNSAVSNPSGEKLVALFDLSEFEISAPQFEHGRQKKKTGLRIINSIYISLLNLWKF
jgi:hypothetical protein